MALGRVAGAASFLLVAETGQFNADIGEAERKWASTTARMSEETLRVDLAARKLRETLARYPNDVARVERATLSYRSAQRQATAATVSHTEAVQKQISVSRGLGGAIRFASTALIGGYGLLYGLKATLKAAEEHQVVMGQLRVAVRDAGLSYREQAAGIHVALKAREDLGFAEADAVRSYSTLIRATKDVAKANELQAVAANIARARHKTLEQATDAVAKAIAGQGTALKRLLPGLHSTAKGYALVADAARSTAGAAATWGRTAAGAQARFDVALHRTSVTIGTALLPAVTQYLTKGANWLDQSRNQARVQRDVREAAKVAGTAIHVLTGFIEGATDAAKPLVKGLGGVENAMKLAFGVLVLRRVGLLRLGILGVGTAADTAAAGGVATLSAALSGLLAKLASLGADSPLFAILTGPPADASRRVGLSALVHDANRKMSTKDVIAEAKSLLGVDITAAQVAALRKLHSEQGKSISDATAAAASAIVGGQKYTGSRKGLFDRIPHDPTGKTGVRPAPPSATIPRTLADAVLSAALTSGTADDLRAARAEEGYLRAQLARAKKGTQLYSDILAALVSAHSQTESVLSQINSEQKRHGKAVDRKRKERQAAEDKRLADNAAYNIARIQDRGKEFAALMKGRKYQSGRGGSGSFDAERFFLEQQSSFFGSYNSNDFTGKAGRRTPGGKDASTVVFNNHQHFQTPTADRHREARLAYNAYRAQFDG